MTTVDELVTWMREQMDRDAYLAAGGAIWTATYMLPGGHILISADGTNRAVGSLDGGEVHHAVNWDPARVLAEVEAKRRILDEWGRLQPDREVTVDQPRYSTAARAALMDRVVLHLAQPLASRPGFRDEWRLT